MTSANTTFYTEKINVL